MFLRTSLIHKLRILSIQTVNVCSNKKDPPEPAIAVPIAPKVIAKKPPIEELTKGRVFDARTQTYKIAPVSKLFNASATNQPPSETVGAKAGEPKPPGTSSEAPPRMIREEAGKVFFCLIPDGWVQAFNPKTGVTGFWTFAFTYGTYLLSHEKIIMEHDYYCALSHIVLWGLVVVYIGPAIAAGLDKSIDEIEAGFNQERVDAKQSIEDSIAHEQGLQLSSAEQLVLVAAKRENVDLQLEAEYRMRQMMVYKRIKDMLDFQIAYDLVQRRFAQQQMVHWTMEKVYAAITDDLDSTYVDQCLVQLEELSQKAAIKV